MIDIQCSVAINTHCLRFWSTHHCSCSLCYLAYTVGYQQRYATHICSGQTSEPSPRFDWGSWGLLPWFDTWPRVLGLPLLLLPHWCPVESSCLALFLFHANPTPSPLHDDGLHAFLVAPGKTCIGFYLRLLVWKVDSLLRFMVFSSSSSLSLTVGWKVFSFGAVLAWSWCCKYWADFHILFNILKVFQALLRWLLMMLIALPLCLTLLPR